MGRKNRTPVVIVRKDKKLRKGFHLAAFLLTGGASAPITAAKAATNAGYNARTRQLQREAANDSDRNWSDADHERARRAGEAAMAKLNSQKKNEG